MRPGGRWRLGPFLDAQDLFLLPDRILQASRLLEIFATEDDWKRHPPTSPGFQFPGLFVAPGQEATGDVRQSQVLQILSDPLQMGRTHDQHHAPRAGLGHILLGIFSHGAVAFGERCAGARGVLLARPFTLVREKSFHSLEAVPHRCRWLAGSPMGLSGSA